MNHWPVFAEFCRQELAIGGPDPQIATLEQLTKRQSLESRIWMIGCYGAHHCVPSAYLVWSAFTARDVIDHPRELRRWLKTYWSGLPVRPEMRSHRMLEKRAKCLLDFAHFARWYHTMRYSDYDEAWIDTQKRVKFFGRYMAIKVLEMMSRFGDSPHLTLMDMRAKGGWSPRVCLSLLWDEPKYAALADRGDSTSETIELVERVFRRTRRALMEEFDVRVSSFQLQVLLCEYKEALAGGYYPGASLDEELVYIAQAKEHFQGVIPMTRIFTARRAVFHPKHLGEVKGWSGPREDKFTPFKVSRDLR